MTGETPPRTVRRVSDDDLQGWQRDLVEESRRLSRHEKTRLDAARQEAAGQRKRQALGSRSDQREDR